MTSTASEPATGYRVYRYRWAVLGAFMFVNLTMQMLWIAYAPVTNRAARFYGATHLEIGLLAMVFMIVFIPMSIPAAWLIDNKGLRKAVGGGALLMGVCGLARGLAGHDYAGAMVATIGIAVAQPFLLNAWTKVPALWFAKNERATGVGLATLANLVGIAAGEALTPILVKSLSIASVQLLYGSLAMASALVFVAVVRDRPATPPCDPESETRALVLDGLRRSLRTRPFLVYLGVWFAGMGIFNGILTWIDEIMSPRHFSSVVAGTVGALLLVGGIIGIVAIAPLSDRSGRRVRYMLIGLVCSMPMLVGVTFAGSLWLLYLTAFAFGFFLISVAPIGMQYCAEVTLPAPEGTSQGLLQLAGQLSVVIVYLMTAMRGGHGSYTPALLFCLGLLVVAAGLVSRLHDPARPAASERRDDEPLDVGFEGGHLAPHAELLERLAGGLGGPIGGEIPVADPEEARTGA